MASDRTTFAMIIALALALGAPFAAQAADSAQSDASLVPKAVAFVRTLAAGGFDAAEADFTDQMKQAASPEQLRAVWQGLISQAGPFQTTGNTKSIVQGQYTTVIVRTEFKSSPLGIAVTFDSAHRIAGMHFVAPP